MRKILFASLVLLAVSAVSVEAQSFSHHTGEYGAPGDDLAVPGPNSITQNVDTVTITPVNSVSCNAGGIHTDNSYIRRFFLNTDHGIVGSFSVESLDWAIETAFSVGGTQPVDVNLYSIANGDPLTFGNLTPIGSTSISVADVDLAGVNTLVSGTISDPTTTDLVVEVFTPNGAGVAGFFIGSNAGGQTQPTYLAAADCGLPEPTATAAIGFPDMHVIMVVNGTEAGVPTMGGWGLALLIALLACVAFWVLRQRAPLHTS